MAITEEQRALFLPKSTIPEEQKALFLPEPDAIIPSQTGGIPGGGDAGGGVPGPVDEGLIAPDVTPDAPPSQPGIPILPQGVPDGRFSGEADSLSPIIFGEEDQPSTFARMAKAIEDFMLRRGATPVGVPAPAVTEAFTQAGLPIPGQTFSEEDTAKLQELFKEQQRFALGLLESMDYLDRPRRVITNVAFRLQEQGQFALENFGRPKELQPIQFAYTTATRGLAQPRFTSVKDAMGKGWSGDDSVSLLKVGEAGILGVDISNKVEAWEKRHWQTKYPRIIADGLSNLAGDALIDFGIVKGVLLPIKSAVKAGALRYGTEAMKDSILKASKSALDEGFESVATKAVNDAANLSTTARRSLDDMIQESIDNAPDIAPVGAVFQATEAEILEQQAELLVRRVKVGKLKAQIDGVGKQIENLDFESSPLAKAEAGFRRFKLQTRQGLLSDQLVESTKQADEARSILSEIQRLGHAVDYKATIRVAREAYVEASINSIDNIKDLDSIKHFIRLASGGVTDDIAELSDEGFDALFDFIDARAKDPSNWNYLSTDAPGPLGAAKRAGRSIFLNQTVSPAWQVFRRLGGERIYQFVDDAFFNRYTHLEKSLSEWEIHLKQIGVKSRVAKRSAKEAESLRKVFLMADGRMTKLEDGVATFNVTKGRVAKESWITPVSPEEIAAAGFANKEAKVLADMAVAQGRLSHTGADAPKVIDHYMTHLFDRSVVEAGLSKEALQAEIKKLTLSLADETDPARLKAISDSIEELRGAVMADTVVSLERIAELYDFAAKTDVNIPEFLRRINAREGLIEDADLAFRTMANHETDALYMQPAYKAANAMATETGNDNLRNFTRKWINDLRGVPTRFEAALEPLAQDVSALLEHGTAWLPEWTHLQWKAQDRAIRQFSKTFRSRTYLAAMGFNPGPVATNMTQSMLTIGAIGTKSTFKGFESLTTAGGKSMLRHSRLLIGRNPMHTISLREMSRLSKASSYTFRMVDQWMNVAPAFNGSLHKQIAGNADKMAILRRYGVPEGRGFWETTSKALDAGEFANEVNIANRVAKTTQYSYLRHDAPAFLRTPLGSAFGQFLSWPANYWQSYIPEMTKWMVSGQSPFGPLSIIERSTLLRHVVLAETLIAAGDQAGIDLRKHRPIAFGGDIPIPLPGGPAPQTTPALRIIQGMVGIATSQGNQRKMNAGILELKKGFMVGPAALPIVPFFPAGLRRIEKVLTEGDIRPLFFRMSEKDKAAKRTGFGGFKGFGGGNGGFKGF